MSDISVYRRLRFLGSDRGAGCSRFTQGLGSKLEQQRDCTSAVKTSSAHSRHIYMALRFSSERKIVVWRVDRQDSYEPVLKAVDSRTTMAEYFRPRDHLNFAKRHQAQISALYQLRDMTAPIASHLASIATEATAIIPALNNLHTEFSISIIMLAATSIRRLDPFGIDTMVRL